jgi:rhamnulokinase
MGNCCVMQEPARVAIDLGAESCRVSLLRWVDGPGIEVIHRIPNGPVHRGDSLYWPLTPFLPALKRAAQGCRGRSRGHCVDRRG